MATKKITECPRCGARVSACWTNGRKLRLECRRNDDIGDETYCDWTGKPYTPPKKPVRTVKTITAASGWLYECFDQYGHLYISSRTYASRALCREAAKDDIRMASRDPDMGKCTAVIWPPTTILRGEKIT